MLLIKNLKDNVMQLHIKNNYRWVYFLDDSYEEWLTNMPTGGVIAMPDGHTDESSGRNFLIIKELEDMTAAYSCTINEVPLVTLD